MPRATRLLTVLASLAAGLIWTAGAQAGSVYLDEFGGAHYRAEPGEHNDLQISSPSAGIWRLKDSGASISGSCTISADRHTATCAGAHGVEADLGDEDDRAKVGGTPADPYRVRLYGGNGNDSLAGGPESDTLDGDGLGTDEFLQPPPFEPGDDVLSGHEGNDSLMGGPGADTITGGDGIDEASYVEMRAAPVHVTLNDGHRNDGNAVDDAPLRSGDRAFDDVEGVEAVSGSFQDGDLLEGDDGDNTLALIRSGTALGGGGADRLIGSDGDDTLIGGPGTDALFNTDPPADGEFGGHDVFETAGDGSTDSITCGTNVFDTAAGHRDSGDTVTSGCGAIKVGGGEQPWPAYPGRPRVFLNSTGVEVRDDLLYQPGPFGGLGVTVSYQWIRCNSPRPTDGVDQLGQTCTPIPNSSYGSRYWLQPADLGMWVGVRATATNANGTRVRDSKLVGPVVKNGSNGPPTPDFKNGISGPVITVVDGDFPFEVGQHVAVQPMRFIGLEPLTTSYRWVRCPRRLQGDEMTVPNCHSLAQNTASYEIQAADVGKYIGIRSRAENSKGVYLADSDMIGPIQAAASGSSSSPSTGGSAVGVTTLRADARRIIRALPARLSVRKLRRSPLLRVHVRRAETVRIALSAAVRRGRIIGPGRPGTAHQRTLARGHRAFAGPRTRRVKLTTTNAGRRLLRRVGSHRSIRVGLSVTVTPRGAASPSSALAGTLHVIR